LWALLVMVIPDVSALAAAQLRPIPDVSEISIQKGLSAYQINLELTKADSDLSRQQMQARRESKPSGDAAMEQYRKDEENRQKLVDEFGQKTYETNLRIDRDYQLRKDAQAGLAKNLSRVSPASGLTLGAASLAGTGVDEYGRFVESARNFGTIFRDWYSKTNAQKKRDTTRFGGTNSDGSPYFSVPMGDILTIQEALATMPSYEFEPESLGRSFQRALPDFALMAFMALVFLAGACVAFMRYDVR